MQEFEHQYDVWMKGQLESSSGERRRRLLKRRHAENKLLTDILWPVLRSFEYLHAEYEVADFKDGVRFLDFAYIRPPYRSNIEADGFGPHASDINRRDFGDERMRQNHLVLDDWKVFRFSYDDIRDHPRQCQQVIMQMLGKLYGGVDPYGAGLSLEQREILRYADHVQRMIRVADVCLHLGVSDKHARRLLKELVDSGHLRPIGGPERVHRYERIRGRSNY